MSTGSDRRDEEDEAPLHLGPAARRAYLDARIQGLCHEGALEIAEGVERAAAAPAPISDDAASGSCTGDGARRPPGSPRD